MRKSLSLLVMESEKEYKITLLSVVNIHDKEHLDKIKSGLLGHQVRKVEADRVIPFTGKAPKEWAEVPQGLPVYTVDIVIGMRMSHRDIVELLCLYTGIQRENFCVTGDVEMEKLEESNIMAREVQVGQTIQIQMEPPRKVSEVSPMITKAKTSAISITFADGTKEMCGPLQGVTLRESIKDGTDTDDVESAQDQVGQKRLDKFMSELKSQKAEREKKTKVLPIYEAFCASAIEVRNLLREGVIGRGYWFIRNMGENRISVMGPYSNIPVGVVMTEGVVRNMTAKRGSVVSVDHGTLTEYVVDLEDDNWKRIDEGQPYEVKVKDTSSGQTYTAAVRASDELAARNLGIEQVHASEGIPKDSLLALSPTS